MNNDIRAALLGDKEAAKRLTDAGVLLPCGHCKGRAVLVEGKLQAVGKYSVVCGECFCATTWCTSKEDASRRWNTRAPILGAEEMKILEGRNEMDKTSKFENLDWEKVRELIEDAIQKRDRSVSIYYSPYGFSVAVYPWPDTEAQP